MITMLGTPRRFCDGITRRETLKAGALSLLGGGFTLDNLLRAEEARPAPRRPGKAKSVILLFLGGGAATQDIWDLKPGAPVGIRSEFQPIATNVPGIQICEHLPRMSRWMHKAALIRSVNHKAGCHNFLPAYTGLELPGSIHPSPNDPPSMGSVCEYLRQQGARQIDHRLPDYVYMPFYLGWGTTTRRSGPYGGCLGSRYDPLFTECEPRGDKGARARGGYSPVPVRGQPYLPNSTLIPSVTVDRLNARRSLLQQIDEQLGAAEGQQAMAGHDRAQQRAFGVLTSAAMRAPFDLDKVDAKERDRYGRTLFGESTLIARRCVEAGVRFVNVTWDGIERVYLDVNAWDTHDNGFATLKGNHLPTFDQTCSALLEDLDRTGRLDETLVVVMSEMGRTPRIVAQGGRDHWTYCYSALLMGAGIKGGTVCGASDAHAAYVKDRPVSPADICASIYHCLGIEPDQMVIDRAGRPIPAVANGKPIREILA
ncbi:MAG: DUF1501 domain-containing protein [Gemmataceae bacterium]|nr:DUF1501 domain-containing protein [Gemmataceae bacterium]